jgi:predicted ATPase/DNA-binding CsgD family transcriptional regulator
VTLTRRELEVARLVSEGLTDREIASKLFLAKRTVEWHLEQVRDKLGFDNRAQIAAWIGKQGPAGASIHAPAATAPLHNLPLRATAFVGRERELIEIRRLLALTRLLTLTGAAGVGKTRLAQQAATEVLEEYPDGAWFVDLGPIGDPSLAFRTVASALRIRERPGRLLLEALADGVSDRRLLLVLDNCEHLIDACARLADSILRRGRGPTLLATSRERLRVEGETSWRVQPLTIPPAGLGSKPDQLLAWESVTLFCDRARKVAPSYRLTQENGSAVAEICRRLDGIPLAIELAAARLGIMSSEQILTRLEDRFRLLTGGSRTAIARQQTLRAALDWSYGLLSDDERKVFCQLSVFAGGFTLEAAEAVVSGADGDPVTVLDLLNGLVDKSMVVCVEDATGQVRYGMLDTLQQYGQERLVKSPEMEAVREAHLRYFLAFAEEASPKLLDRSLAAIERVEREFANLRLALAWASSSDVNRCLRMAVALEQYWVMRGRFTEGREALTLALAADAGDPALRSRALAEMARLCVAVGDAEGADSYAWQAIAVGRQAGPCVGLSRGLAMAGNHSMWLGELARARALFDESIRVAADAGESKFCWHGQMGQVLLAFDQGDMAQGRRLGEELLASYSEAYDPHSHCLTRWRLAEAECGVGDLEAAARHLMVAVPLAARFGFHGSGSDALRICSRVEAARGREERRWRLVGAAMSLRGHCGLSLLTARSGEVWPPEPDPSRVAPQAVPGLIGEGEAPNEAYEYALAGLSVLQRTPANGLAAPVVRGDSHLS